MTRLRTATVRQAGPVSRGPRPAPLPAHGRVDGRRRSRPIRRASAGLTSVRAGALLALVLSTVALYGATTTDAFALHRTDVTGAVYTSRDTIDAALDVPAGANLFEVRTGDLAARLREIPAIRSVDVAVVLPDRLRVVIHEREPLLAWRVGGGTFLVDSTGFVLAQLGDHPPAGAAVLPVVDDRRAASVGLEVGAVIDPVSLDAALRIGSLLPADVGSDGTRLGIAYDDTDGFTVTGAPSGWTAVFGFYTLTLRPTDLIPGQVRLLRSVLAGQEGKLARILLADDKSGTLLPRSTPKPSAKP
jgi:cell division protein FtsQ